MKYYITLIILTVFWGISYTVVKNGIEEMPIEEYQLIRYLFAAIVILILFYKKIFKINRKTYFKGFLTVGISSFLAMLFTIYAMKTTSASHVAFFVSCTIITVPIIVYIHKKRKPTNVQLRSIIVCFAGALLFTKPWETDLTYGNILLILAVISYGYQYYFTEKYVKEIGVEQTTFIQMLTACIGFSLLYLFKSNHSFTISDITMELWVTLIFIGVFITGLAWLLEIYLQKHIPPTNIVIILAMEPVFTFISEWIVRGKPLDTIGMMGGTFIVVSGLLSIKKSE